MAFVMPFVFMAVGGVVGFRLKGDATSKSVDLFLNVSLLVLMASIGIKVGGNKSLVEGLVNLGLNALTIAVFAVAGSILCAVVIERFIMSLSDVKAKLQAKQSEIGSKTMESEGGVPFWAMPAALVLGVAFGAILLPDGLENVVEVIFTVSLAILYIGVGLSFGLNRWVFKYLKMISLKVLFIPVGIIIGSLLGGFLAGLVLHMDLKVSMCAAAGMGYYSLPGAVMTQYIGIEAGAYGFLVNVIREFISILCAPLFVKLSIGSPMASGAAGCADVVLFPVIKVAGLEIGMIALLSGTALTFAVPALLTLLLNVMH